uniref:Uncharacterized protein n=1 Tax=Timema bartmani TaxID=61472 RepID=A0A7R9HZY3_9NEOP|nr:unnamed protein product [Timema bartmani]
MAQGRPRISYYDLINQLSPDISTNASVKESDLEDINLREDVAKMRTNFDSDLPKISTRSEAIDEALLRNSSTVRLSMTEKIDKIENKLVTHSKETTNMTSLIQENNQNQKISTKKETVARRHLKSNHKKSATHKQKRLSTKIQVKTDNDNSKPQTHEITAILPSMYKKSRRAYVDRDDSNKSTNTSKVKVPAISRAQQYENSTLTTQRDITAENRHADNKQNNSKENVKSQETNDRIDLEEFDQILASKGIESNTERTEFVTFLRKTLVSKKNDYISIERYKFSKGSDNKNTESEHYSGGWKQYGINNTATELKCNNNTKKR